MLKRFFDILCSIVALVILSPVTILVAWQIRRKLGPPVLFRQIRPGLHGKPFEMVKFRTMRNEFDSEGNSLPDAERLTPFGSFLRSTSLDELPELWNVIKGDMSLVGPRPLLIKYVPFFTEREKLRHNMRPGITGWSQIKGRNNLPWDERLSLDVWYVENWSFWLDIKILFETFLAVIQKRGVVVIPTDQMLDLDKERSLSRDRSNV